MAYTLPNFNLVANQWRGGDPLLDPPFATRSCQFYINMRFLQQSVMLNNYDWRTILQIRLPMGTDVLIGDVFEVAQGSGRYYYVVFEDRAHLGFSNEYHYAFVQPITPLTVPFNVLMEDGFNVLAEDTFNIIME